MVIIGIFYVSGLLLTSWFGAGGLPLLEDFSVLTITRITAVRSVRLSNVNLGTSFMIHRIKTAL